MTIAKLAERPFFIVGHPRSGTTLLRVILSSHSRLHIPEETGFIPFLKVDPKVHLTQKEVEKLLERIGQLNYLWRHIVKKSSDFYSKLPDAQLPFVLDALYRIQTSEFHASRWGDKTPLYVQYIPTINEIFPDAQFIHLIRDGRDAALSAHEKWGARSPYMNLYYLIKNWVRNVEAGQQAGLWLGKNRYLQIKYEDMVTAPEQTIRAVCNFLNEDFEISMLDHTPLAHYLGGGPNQNTEVLVPIHEASIGRWKSEMSEFDLKLVNQQAGKALSNLGYEVPRLAEITIFEQVRIFGDGGKFFFYDSLRSFLYKTGHLTLNRNMRNSE